MPVPAAAAAVGAAVKLAYKPAMALAKKLAKKYWSKGADKERIIKEAKDKGILEKFNNFKLKNDPSKPLKQRKADGHTPAGKKPSLDVYDKTGAGVGRKKGGPVKKYARGGGVRKAARY